MKLFYSGNSPYARRPRIVAREAGLMDRIEEVDSGPLGGSDSILFNHGPGGKVPGLLTDNGVYLCESLIICRYLNDLSGGSLLPSDPKALEDALHIDGIASLLMDSLFTRSRENRRDASEQSPGVIKIEAARAGRTYDELEKLAGGFGDTVHLGMTTIVAALGYADWRHASDDWRSGRPELAGWFEKMMQRPSMDETKPIF
jgi:glutathione S-transferase